MSAAISCVLITCLLQVPHIWYQSTFLGTRGKNFFGRRLSDQFLKLFAQNQKKQIAYLNSSFKNTQFQKNNHLIWSSKSGDIADLNQHFFRISVMTVEIAERKYFDWVPRFLFRYRE